ncbi:MAG: PD-(D/E)XK nuclease family protein [Muribaculaceae bacterium]|nr:PD-(D/E)XK nuclease family protein [Muribaculaceae bacterium]
MDGKSDAETARIYCELLASFRRVPKAKLDPTFMEICHMSGDRFEEKCSKVLQFYLQPKGPHRLGRLMLSALLEAAGEEALDFSLHETDVRLEEPTEEGKKIDITVVADSFVLAIENKIDASLYNSLDVYGRHIRETYPDRKVILVVLSARRISDCGEREKIRLNGYRYVNYFDLFEILKSRFGAYAADANAAYAFFLFDFIRTIENRYGTRNMELKRFFYDNRQAIQELIDEYRSFEDEIFRIRKERIGELLDLIQSRTKATWWVYRGWDLGIKFNEGGKCIGIESCFEHDTLTDPLGDFCIYVTVWNRSHFKPYREELEAAFPDCEIDYNPTGLPSRIYLHIKPIPGSDTKRIVDRLEEVYKIVKAIADKHLE